MKIEIPELTCQRTHYRKRALAICVDIINKVEQDIDVEKEAVRELTNLLRNLRNGLPIGHGEKL